MIKHSIISEEHVIDFRCLLVALKSNRDTFEGDQKDEQYFSQFPLLFHHLTTFEEVDGAEIIAVITVGEIEKETGDGFA